MVTLKDRVLESKSYNPDSQFLDFLFKILEWEPEKRLKPQEALQHPWIRDGLPAEFKELNTVFTSLEYSKDRSRSKNSKNNSKNKSNSKRSKNNSKGRDAQLPQRKDTGQKEV